MNEELSHPGREKYKLHPASHEDLVYIDDLEHETWDDSKVEFLGLDRLQNWYSANALGFRVIKDHTAQNVGFIYGIPLWEAATQDILFGRRNELEITPNDIVPQERRGEAKYIFLSSLIIHPDHRQGNALRELIRFLLQFFSDLAPLSPMLQILAIAIPDGAGEKFLQDLGFQLFRDRGEHRHLYRVYWARFPQIENSRILKPDSNVVAGEPVSQEHADRPAFIPCKDRYFLAYIRENIDQVEALRQDVECQSHHAFWDPEFGGGSTWGPLVKAAIKDVYAFVVCISSHVNRRETFVHTEARWALARGDRMADDRIFVIPVLLDDCPIPSISSETGRNLDRLTPIRLFPEDARARGLQELICALNKARLQAGES